MFKNNGDQKEMAQKWAKIGDFDIVLPTNDTRWRKRYLAKVVERIKVGGVIVMTFEVS